MLSEKQFADYFHSFWRDALPYGDYFLRHLNGVLARRLPFSSIPYVEASIEATPRQVAMIASEAAFMLYADTRIGRLYNVKQLSEPEVLRSFSLRLGKRLGLPPAIIETFMLEARPAIEKISARLASVLMAANVPLPPAAEPLLPGLGVLRACRPDFFFDGMLVEVKSVRRNFRAVDVRQLAIYATLALTAGMTVDRIVIVNPLNGMHFSTDTHAFFRRSAGTSPTEATSRIASFLCQLGSERDRSLLVD